MLAVGNTGSCVGPQNKGAHPAHRYGQLMRVSVLTDRGISVGCKHVLPYGCFSVFAIRNCGHNFDFLREIDMFYEKFGVLSPSFSFSLSLSLLSLIHI